MPDVWEIDVHLDNDKNKKVVGVVKIDGADIIAFVSAYDFRDTNYDTEVSFAERAAGFVSFQRGIFVSTAIAALQDAILDPSIRSFDYSELNRIRYTNAVDTALTTTSEIFSDLLRDAVIGYFGGPVFNQIFGRMIGASDVLTQFLLTPIGEHKLGEVIDAAVSVVPADKQYDGYAVKYVGNGDELGRKPINRFTSH